MTREETCDDCSSAGDDDEAFATFFALPLQLLVIGGRRSRRKERTRETERKGVGERSERERERGEGGGGKRREGEREM